MTVKTYEFQRAVRNPARNLSSSEFAVAMAISTHAGPDGTDAHPGQKLLADETRLGESTVYRAIKSLRAKGWLLQVYSGRGGSHDRASVYHLAIPNSQGDGLYGDSTGQGDGLGAWVKQSRRQSQTVTGAIPNSQGDGTDSPGDNPVNEPALHRGSDRKLKGKCDRKPGCWLGAGHQTPCRSNPLQNLRSPRVPEPSYDPELDWVL